MMFSDTSWQLDSSSGAGQRDSGDLSTFSAEYCDLQLMDTCMAARRTPSPSHAHHACDPLHVGHDQNPMQGHLGQLPAHGGHEPGDPMLISNPFLLPHVCTPYGPPQAMHMQMSMSSLSEGYKGNEAASSEGHPHKPADPLAMLPASLVNGLVPLSLTPFNLTGDNLLQPTPAADPPSSWHDPIIPQDSVQGGHARSRREGLLSPIVELPFSRKCPEQAPAGDGALQAWHGFTSIWGLSSPNQIHSAISAALAPQVPPRVSPLDGHQEVPKMFRGSSEGSCENERPGQQAFIQPPVPKSWPLLTLPRTGPASQEGEFPNHPHPHPQSMASAAGGSAPRTSLPIDDNSPSSLWPQWFHQQDVAGDLGCASHAVPNVGPMRESTGGAVSTVSHLQAELPGCLLDTELPPAAAKAATGQFPSSAALEAAREGDRPAAPNLSSAGITKIGSGTSSSHMKGGTHAAAAAPADPLSAAAAAAAAADPPSWASAQLESDHAPMRQPIQRNPGQRFPLGAHVSLPLAASLMLKPLEMGAKETPQATIPLQNAAGRSAFSPPQPCTLQGPVKPTDIYRHFANHPPIHSEPAPKAPLHMKPADKSKQDGSMEWAAIKGPFQNTPAVRPMDALLMRPCDIGGPMGFDPSSKGDPLPAGHVESNAKVDGDGLATASAAARRGLRRSTRTTKPMWLINDEDEPSSSEQEDADISPSKRTLVSPASCPPPPSRAEGPTTKHATCLRAHMPRPPQRLSPVSLVPSVWCPGLPRVCCNAPVLHHDVGGEFFLSSVEAIMQVHALPQPARIFLSQV